MEKSQAILLNEIIEKVYTIQDYRQMRISLLEMLGTLIPYLAATYYLASDSEHLMEDPVGVGITQEQLQRYIDEYEEKDYSKWIFMSGKSLVYRETDLFPDKMRLETEYFQGVYAASNLYYSAQMSIAHGGDFLGVVCLYRDKAHSDFTDEELFYLELLKSHLEYRMTKEWKAEQKIGASGDIQSHNKGFDGYKFMEKYGLTSRETQVLGLLFTGLEADKISETLVISPNTLKKHALSIYKKLGISGRWELIKFLR